MIDTHCHILPGLDDGPKTWDESLQLAHALVADGITEVIATPHQLGMFDNAGASVHIRSGVERLNTELIDAGINLRVYPGAEIHLDVHLLKLLDSGCLLTLADSQYLLLELPADVFIDIATLILDLAKHSFVPVIAHAERLRHLAKHTAIPSRWQEAGAVLQVTAAGLLGDWGSSVRRHAWQMILDGAASLLATDAHDTDTRYPRLKDAHAAVAAKLGRHIADRLTIENPKNIIAGNDLIPLFGGQNLTLTPNP